MLAVLLATAFVGNVQHLRAVSDSGRAVCPTGVVMTDVSPYCLLTAAVAAVSLFALSRLHSPRDRAVCNRLHVNGGGNVAAAVCSASASSLLGIFLSPLLVGLVMNVHGAGGRPLSRSAKLCCNCCCHLCWGIFPGRGLVTARNKNGLRKLTRRPFCW